MTLPLQPMDTAPRDGSEVLLVLADDYSVGISKTVACWSKDDEAWMLSDGTLFKNLAFSGWLDLKELVRDAERLELLYKLAEVSRSGVLEIVLPLTDAAAWDGTTCNWDRSIFNAAIDKEMERNEP